MCVYINKYSYKFIKFFHYNLHIFMNFSVGEIETNTTKFQEDPIKQYDYEICHLYDFNSQWF